MLSSYITPHGSFHASWGVHDDSSQYSSAYGCVCVCVCIISRAPASVHGFSECSVILHTCVLQLSITWLIYCWYPCRLLLMSMQTTADVYADYCWYLFRLLLISMQTIADVYADYCWCLCRLLLISIQTIADVYADYCWCLCRLLLISIQTIADIHADYCWCLCRLLLISIQTIADIHADYCWHTISRLGACIIILISLTVLLILHIFSILYICF